MGRKKYKQYSMEFKKDTLQLLETSGKSVAEVERDLGLSSGLLYKWCDKYQVVENDAGQNSLEVSDVEAAKAEIRRLKKELETVIKKAAIYFANEQQ